VQSVVGEAVVHVVGQGLDLASSYISAKLFQDLPLGETRGRTKVDRVPRWIHQNLVVESDLERDEILLGDLAGFDASTEESAVVAFVISVGFAVFGCVVVVVVEVGMLHFDNFVVGLVVVGLNPNFVAEFLHEMLVNLRRE